MIPCLCIYYILLWDLYQIYLPLPLNLDYLLLFSMKTKNMIYRILFDIYCYFKKLFICILAWEITFLMLKHSNLKSWYQNHHVIIWIYSINHVLWHFRVFLEWKMSSRLQLWLYNLYYFIDIDKFSNIC